MKTYGEYVREDYEVHGSPFDFEPQIPAPVKNGATEKQINFLIKLMNERDLPWTQDQLDKLTKKDASSLIDTILSAPKAPKKVPAGKPAAPKAPEITDGMYLNPETGEIFKVQYAVHGSGKLYAKKLVVWEDEGNLPASVSFEYAPGMVYKLRPEWRMTLDQAKEFGALYGTCCVCARTLTKEESIEAGIGPICAGKF